MEIPKVFESEYRFCLIPVSYTHLIPHSRQEIHFGARFSRSLSAITARIIHPATMLLFKKSKKILSISYTPMSAFGRILIILSCFPPATHASRLPRAWPLFGLFLPSHSYRSSICRISATSSLDRFLRFVKAAIKAGMDPSNVFSTNSSISAACT